MKPRRSTWIITLYLKLSVFSQRICMLPSKSMNGLRLSRRVYFVLPQPSKNGRESEPDAECCGKLHPADKDRLTRQLRVQDFFFSLSFFFYVRMRDVLEPRESSPFWAEGFTPFLLLIPPTLARGESDSCLIAQLSLLCKNSFSSLLSLFNGAVMPPRMYEYTTKKERPSFVGG